MHKSWHWSDEVNGSSEREMCCTVLYTISFIDLHT